MLSTLPFLISPNTASVPFTQLQNLPSLFTVGKRKTILCKIASGEWEFLWLAAEFFLCSLSSLFIVTSPHHSRVCLFLSLFTLGIWIVHQINVHLPRAESQTIFLGWCLWWSGPYPKHPSWPIYSIVWPAFRCSAGPLMLLAMALSSSHLNNAAEHWVKRLLTRSVPIMRFFGGRGHTVKPLWIAVLWWVTAVQLGQHVLSSLSAK